MKKILTRGLLVALLASGSLTMIFASGATEEPVRQVEALNLQIAALKGPTGLGMIKLFRDNPSLGENVQAELRAYGGPDVLLPRLLTGEVDLAVLPTNLAANLYNRGAPYQLLAVVGNGVLYLISTDPNKDSLESFQGEVLQNVAKGSTPEFILRHLLEHQGLEGDVELRYKYGIVELAQMIIAGRETSGVLPEPFASKVLQAAPEARIAVDIQEEWAKAHPDLPSFPMSALVVKKTLVEDHPQVLTRFLEAYRESQDWVLGDPGAAGELAEKLAFGIGAAEAREAIPRCGLSFVPASEARPLVEGFLSVFMQFAPEALGGKLPDEGFYAAP